MDLGNSLAYWIQKSDPSEMEVIRLMPTKIDGALTREDMVKRYSDKSGMAIENFDFYYCFGLFRLAVIAQQIYYRYYHGQTTDERFRMLIVGVKVLENASLRVIEKSKL
jgi:aminoglycoside phosphotransferase (APT) family kinase protein